MNTADRNKEVKKELLPKNNVNLQDLLEEAIKSIEKMKDKEPPEGPQVNIIELQEDEEDLETFLKKLEEEEKQKIAAHTESQKVQEQIARPTVRKGAEEEFAEYSSQAAQPTVEHEPRLRAEPKPGQPSRRESIIRKSSLQILEQEKIILTNDLSEAKKIISQLNDQIEIQRLKFEEFIKQKDEQLQQLIERLNQFQTEFVNYKRRVEREKEEFKRFSLEDFVNQLLPVLDGLELGIKHSKNGTGYEAVIKGLEKVIAKFYNVLNSFGVQPIEAEEKAFNPEVHEAVSQLESKEFEDGIIVTEMQKGFKMHDRLLRASKVIVAKNKKEG